ncbi:MAG: hypothetical protein JSW38_10000 [Dehalococcoidia bacterium]|nr:MAG: hypothetical protein JSW38_10000 [Dehalococcoidia bacterium]
MSDLILTEQERAAFYQEITRNRALDYFYVFDNVPLHFVYKDKLIPGELTDLEKRNKAITETVWLEAYHQYLVANVSYLFLYQGQGRVLQMVFQVHQFGAGIFAPPAEESRQFQATVEEVQASFDTWMVGTGWKIVDDVRKQPPRASWQSLLGVPDRTVRIASLTPVGNQVLLELITTWTEEGILKETAWAVVLIYDVDGTVLQDRSYIDLANWPSTRIRRQQGPSAPQNQPETTGVGVMDQFYEYHRSRQMPVELSDLEKRNLSIIEGSWVDVCNTDLNTKVLHPERFRMQLPIQKCSYNMPIAKELEAIVKEVAPDRKMRLALSYAKGNQVMAEGIVSWTEHGVAKEAPFISFLLLDKDGLVIRDRRYLTMDNWPGAEKMVARLGLY